MSLHKTYRVECDGVSLASRLGLTRSGPGVLFHHHQTYGPPAEETAKARGLAYADGWCRVTLEMPLCEGLLNSETTPVAFDLCPGCKHLGSINK